MSKAFVTKKEFVARSPEEVLVAGERGAFGKGLSPAARRWAS